MQRQVGLDVQFELDFELQFNEQGDVRPIIVNLIFKKYF